MDPVRNPYAPGAGQRPPELTGRDREIGQFEVVLERIARGRPERSMVLTGLRGVGKTVLLNTFRSMALQRLWGTGKIEARPGQSIRRPVAAALHMAVRELAPRHRAPDRVEYFLGVLKAFAIHDPKAPKGSSVTFGLGIDVPAQRGRADSGDLEVDLTELFAEAASVAADLGVGIALFVDEMQDVPADDVSALCAACHELSQTGGPLIVVGAGLPHLPSVLSASKSYSERLFRYTRIDRLDREAADLALIAAAWAKRTGGRPRTTMNEAMHVLDEVSDPPHPAPGTLRLAAPRDRDLLVEWMEEFVREAGLIGAGQAGAMIDGYLRRQTLSVWDDGRPVSMIGVNPPVAGVARIGPVYTPPADRRRGTPAARSRPPAGGHWPRTPTGACCSPTWPTRRRTRSTLRSGIAARATGKRSRSIATEGSS